MGAKAGFVVGLGVGYVLGAKAGRERYEDIVRWWHQFTGSPVVQRAAGRTKDMATEGAKRGLTVVQHGVEKAGSAVKHRLHKDEEVEETIVDLVAEQTREPPAQSLKNARESFGPTHTQEMGT